MDAPNWLKAIPKWILKFILTVGIPIGKLLFGKLLPPAAWDAIALLVNGLIQLEGREVRSAAAEEIKTSMKGCVGIHCSLPPRPKL